jgi:arabinogalactan oligomer / maltooligosaccharide transport system permease protein
MAVVTRGDKNTEKAYKKARLEPSRKIPLARQLRLQALCIFIAITVIFPILWVVGVSLTPLDQNRPTGIFPETISLEAYGRVFSEPTQNKVTDPVTGERRPITFWELARNSMVLAAGTSIAAVLIGVSAAYAFSRFQFPGRAALMLAILAVLMLPNVATLAPLYAFLNSFKILDGSGTEVFNLRNSLLGVALAILSGLLPFCIWNMKGYLDTLPKELEEAASIDGCTRNGIFWRIVLPLSLPALAVTALFGFMGGWTEFAFSWQFLNKPTDQTLAMALAGMTGQYARTTPWGLFSAFAILVAIPVMVVYLGLQRWIVGGITSGAVKG